MATATVSLAAIRRLTVVDAGVRARFRRAQARRRRGGDPPADRGAARLDLDRRPRAPADAGARASARYPRDRCRACSRDGPRSSSTGRTRRACSRSSSGRTSARVMEGGGHWGAHDRALRDARGPRRAGARADPRRGPARLARLRGRAATAAACGTGSRRRWCSRRCGTAACSSIAGRAASSARYDLAERVIPQRMARSADADRGRDAAHARAARGRARAAR